MDEVCTSMTSRRWSRSASSSLLFSSRFLPFRSLLLRANCLSLPAVQTHLYGCNVRGGAISHYDVLPCLKCWPTSRGIGNGASLPASPLLTQEE